MHLASRGVALAAGLIIAGVLGAVPPVQGHSAAANSVIDSPWSAAPPAVDGAMAAGEWTDAIAIDLLTIPGNVIAAYLLVKNNATLVWIAYDAVGDSTANPRDTASVAFDTGHDGVATMDADDQFAMGGWVGGTTAHLTYQGGNWSVHDSPFDPGLPNHAGLAGDWGFGPSDLGATPHRIYEFQIPLALLGASPGGTLGFFGGSFPAPGIWDDTIGQYDTWPLNGYLTPSLYGDLNLGLPPGSAVLLTPGSASAEGVPGTSMDFNLTVNNTGPLADTIDLQATSAWTATLWDATGTIPLADTDGDTVPDTGALAGGAGVGIVVRIDVPGLASGCSTTRVLGMSSLSADRDSSDVAICVPKATFTPPHSDAGIDTTFPPNGLYDRLEVYADLSVAVADWYLLFAQLYDNSGTTLLGTNTQNTFLNTGPQTFTLDFPGLAIYTSGISGPYRVNMLLYDGSFALQDNDTHFTAAYLYTDFDPPAVVFAPPHSDAGVDTDAPPNGYFDLLEIGASVDVGVSGSYYIIAELWDQTGTTFITTIGVSPFLSPGLQVVTLLLDGLTIYGSAIDGPYRVDLRVYDASFTLLDTDSFLTGAYLHTDFEPPAALFSPPHSDYGVDLDVPVNGFFDELRVDVNLTVNSEGTYRLYADLYDPFGFYITSTNVNPYLALGPQGVTLAFSGLPLYGSGRDGPYTVALYLYDEFSSFLDSDSHLTAGYLSTDFDPPAILFSPPHGDAGVDTDVPPDGLFNWLRVSASVDVSEARDYRIEGRLYGPFGFPFLGFASATVTLGIGPATVDLDFPGVDIYESGASGNFQVYLDAFQVGSNFSMDYDLYYTNYYFYDEFQPPPGLFSPPHQSAGVDTSSPPDGYFDWLQVDAFVDVTEAGTFSVRGRLDGMFGPIDITSASATLPLGRNPISLYFDGHLINQFAGDGTYWVSLDLYDAAGSQLDFDWFNTTWYLASEFQPLDWIAPSSIASIAGGYWKNTAMVAVDFAATDPTPTDGLDTVTLYARYSTDSVTWGAWTPTSTEAAGGSSLLAGTFLFDATAEGYYEFYTVARDRAGNLEAPPATADAQAAVSIPEVLELTPATDTLPAGSQHTFDVRVLNATGQPVTLEAPLVVTLLTNASGEFRAVGTSIVITTVTIPAGSSTASFDYWDTVAGDAGIAVASTLAGPDTAAVTVAPGPAASLTVSPAVVAVPAGGTGSFTATALDSYGNLVPLAPLAWSVAGTIGTITTGGVFTADTTVASGQVVATSGVLAAVADVTLVPGPLDSIEVTPSAADILAGSDLDLAASALDALGNAVPAAFTWSVTGPGTLSANSGATVTLTADAEGAITVTVTSGARSASSSVTATAVDPGPVDRLVLSTTSADIVVGSDLPLTVWALDAQGRLVGGGTYTWSVSGPGSLNTTTGRSVTLTATGPGTITVTVTSAGKSATATVTATEPTTAGTPAGADLAVGLFAGIIAGLALGVALAWMLFRRGRKPEEVPAVAEPPSDTAQAPEATAEKPV